MKKSLIIFLLLVLAAGAFITGCGMLSGKDLTEGVIEYDITYPKLDPNSMVVQGLPSQAFLRFKNNDMSNDMSGMMGLISITYVAKQSSAKSVAQTLTLISKKYVADISAEQMSKMNSSYIDKIEIGKNSKEIAGFKCKEAIVSLKSGETINVYYTNDIGVVDPNWSNPYSKIDGVLMDFQMERYGLAMHLKAKQVLDQKIDDSVFDITEDFEKIPFDKLEQYIIDMNPSGD